MWKNMVQTDRRATNGNIIRRMRTVCCKLRLLINSDICSTYRFLTPTVVRRRPSFLHLNVPCLSCSQWFVNVPRNVYQNKMPKLRAHYIVSYTISCHNIYQYIIFYYLLTYLRTYLLTPWSRVLLEKLTGLQLVKKFPAFFGTRKFITAIRIII